MIFITEAVVAVPQPAGKLSESTERLSRLPGVTQVEHIKSLQSYLTLGDFMDHSPPGSSIQRFSRQKYWSRLSFPPPGDLPDPGTEPVCLMSPALAGRFFTTSATWGAQVESIRAEF